MYIYESHMGGIYFSEEELDWDMLYCESCGDSDRCIGQVYSFEEAWKLLKENCSFLGSGGYHLAYVISEIISAFSLEDNRLNNISLDYDEYGNCITDDLKCLEIVEKVTGNKEKIFSLKYLTDVEYVLADSLEEAKKKALEIFGYFPKKRDLEREVKISKASIPEIRLEYSKRLK